MEPENTNTETSNISPGEGTAEPAPERTFTQAEVNRIVADRLAREGRSSPAARAPATKPVASIAPADAVKRALAFAAAGYAPDEVEAYAVDATYAAPPPPPRARAGQSTGSPVPPAAVSNTAPGGAGRPGTVAGVGFDASRATAADIAAMSPQALVQAVSGIVSTGRAASGMPVPPHLRLKSGGR